MPSFKLQTVLEYRKRLVDQAQKALQVCLEEQRSLAADMELAEREMLLLCVELHEAKSKDVLVQEVMLYEECILFRKRCARDLDQKLLAVELKVKQKRQELVKAKQEEKALEILKEKRAEEEKRKQRHQENKFLDEVAVIGFGGRK